MQMRHAPRLVAAAGLAVLWYGSPAEGQGHDVPHIEDFEAFDLGPLAPQGGWEAEPGHSALVVDELSRSGRQSIQVVGNSHTAMQYARIHPFSGCYRYAVYNYLPSTQRGETYFLIYSVYDDGGRYQWAVQLHFNAQTGRVTADFGGEWLPTIEDQWVELAVEIDFENDLHQIYYGGRPLFDQPKSWENAMNGGNLPQVGAAGWYGNGVCCQYFDDLDFQKVSCSPTCAYAIRKSKGRRGCETCPQRGDVRQTESPCEAIEDCPKKLKDTIDCPSGPGSCRIRGRRSACE